MDNLSDFIQEVQIRRSSIRAEIIMWYTSHGDPVRLLGFETEPELTDMEIYEKGWNYYQLFIYQINKRKQI